MSTNFLDLTALALLSEQPRHPYDVQRAIRERHMDKSFRATGMPRSLYHAIDRLARRRLIEPAETTREGNRPERTVYRLTEDGQEELQARLRGLLEMPVREYPVLPSALLFVTYMAPEVVLDALEGRAVALISEVAAYDASLRALQEQMRLPRIVLIGLECQRALRQAEVDWVRGLIDELRSGTLTWDWDSLAGHFAAEQARRGSAG